MGGEFGQFIEWNFRQQLDWLLLDYPKHKALQDYCRELNRLYVNTPALYMIDKSWDGFKWLNVNDSQRSAVAFLRMAPEQDSYLVCVCNFTPVRYDGFVIALPESGSLEEILSSDEERFGGHGIRNEGVIHSIGEPFLDMRYSAKLTLPPMSAVYFAYKKEPKGGKGQNGGGEG